MCQCMSASARRVHASVLFEEWSIESSCNVTEEVLYLNFIQFCGYFMTFESKNPQASFDTPKRGKALGKKLSTTAANFRPRFSIL